MKNRSSKKTEPPRPRVNSVGKSSDTSNSLEDERKKGRKTLKNPGHSAREKKRTKEIATAFKQLQTALGADDKSRKQMTHLETLQAAVQFIYDLKEELVGLQLLRNEPSDGVYPVATEPLPTVQESEENLVRICARRCCMLAKLLPFYYNYESFPLAS